MRRIGSVVVCAPVVRALEGPITKIRFHSPHLGRAKPRTIRLYVGEWAKFSSARDALSLALLLTRYAKRGEESELILLLGRVRGNAWLAGDAGNRARAGKTTTTYEQRLADADCRRRSSTATASTAVQRDQPFDARMRVTLRCAATLCRSPSCRASSPPRPPITTAFTMPRKR